MTPYTIASPNGSNRLTIDLEHLVAVSGPMLGYNHGWYVTVKLFFMFRDEPISVLHTVPDAETGFDAGAPTILCVDGQWRGEAEMIYGKAPSSAKAVENAAAEIVVPLELAWKEMQ